MAFSFEMPESNGSHDEAMHQRRPTQLSNLSLPLGTLSSLLLMQEREDHKPRLSKISWLPDVLVFRSSIIPVVLYPVLGVTLFSALIAALSLVWGQEVGLTNNVVPLLSVVVGLLLVFRNTSAYERYSEGRKDFTTLISNARNLARLIWIMVCSIPTDPDAPLAARTGSHARLALTHEKRTVIRLVVAFVIATKHHLRAEGGVHHEDLHSLLPERLSGIDLDALRRVPGVSSAPASPTSPSRRQTDEEAGLSTPLPSAHSLSSQRSAPLAPSRTQLKRRPTAVRVVYGHDLSPQEPPPSLVRHATPPRPIPGARQRPESAKEDERTPLIKPGVKPDVRRTFEEAEAQAALARQAHIGLGRMIELGLPLIIAHEISRSIFRWRRRGCLEHVGPAGVNTLQNLVQSMIDQLGKMERVVQTPMPYVIAVHMKQATSILLFILPFTLVDMLGVKMVPLMFLISIIYLGIEGIAAQVEQPFGSDPCDLNLDLFCTELLCECEGILERLPEGDDDEHDVFVRSKEQLAEDEAADDGGE